MIDLLSGRDDVQGCAVQCTDPGGIVAAEHDAVFVGHQHMVADDQAGGL